MSIEAPKGRICLAAVFRCSFVLALGLSLTACGITAPRHADGFAELGSLGVLDVDRTFSLSIGPSLLRFAARHVDDDPETQTLLQNLDGVRVFIYEIEGDPQRVANRIQRMSDRLGKKGWDQVISVRDSGEETHMLMKVRHGEICGLTFLTSDGESEAVVVNIMGNIQPDMFGGVMLALDVDVPDIDPVRPAKAAN